MPSPLAIMRWTRTASPWTCPPWMGATTRFTWPRAFAHEAERQGQASRGLGDPASLSTDEQANNPAVIIKELRNQSTF